MLTAVYRSGILALIKNCESIEVRCTSVFSVRWDGIPTGKKGESAEVFSDSRSENAGLPENICQTVTKVERYHSSCCGSMPVAVNVGTSPGFTVF